MKTLLTAAAALALAATVGCQNRGAEGTEERARAAETNDVGMGENGTEADIDLGGIENTSDVEGVDVNADANDEAGVPGVDANVQD